MVFSCPSSSSLLISSAALTKDWNHSNQKKKNLFLCRRLSSTLSFTILALFLLSVSFSSSFLSFSDSWYTVIMRCSASTLSKPIRAVHAFSFHLAPKSKYSMGNPFPKSSSECLKRNLPFSVDPVSFAAFTSLREVITGCQSRPTFLGKSSVQKTPNFRCYATSTAINERDDDKSVEDDHSNNSSEKSEEEKARLKAERDARKEAKKLAKEAKKKKKEDPAPQEAPFVFEDVQYTDLTSSSENEKDGFDQKIPKMGNYTLIQSRPQIYRQYIDIDKIEASNLDILNKKVWIRGRISSIRVKGGSAFLVIRDGPYSTIQLCFFKPKMKNHDAQMTAEEEANQMKEQLDSKKMLKFLSQLSIESIVDVYGTVNESQVPIKSCSQSDVEVLLDRIYTVSIAESILPFQIEDAARKEEEVEASQETDRPFPRIGQELRLDNRWLDLRVPSNNCIMRIQSGICQLFRESLYEQNFVEIHTPKLIGGESEGGSDVFRTDYFDQKACLAQSPQLYKQIAIASDMNRVFEIGPVFRAENSNTRRHLCEFTGLDLEMEIQEHYNEVLHVLHKMFIHIFTGLEDRFQKELSIIREQYWSEPVLFTKEPCILHWGEAMSMLKEYVENTSSSNIDSIDELGDLTGAQELLLGKLVREKYNTDFFILDRYPSTIRPFYTMPCYDDSRYSNSYDLFLRGQEICSGAQRIHDSDLLMENIKSKGIDVEPLIHYINAFRAGASPHGGAGIGLERVVFLYLGLDNVRKASMFPRDPNRITP